MASPKPPVRLYAGLAVLIVACLAVGVLAAVLLSRPTSALPSQAPSGASAGAPTTTSDPTGKPPEATEPPADPEGPIDRVVVVSIDGLGSYAVTRRLMPELTRLLREGAGTLNARTMERTVTLPDHTSMVTGRPILRDLGGHGVDWNVDLEGARVRAGVESIFSHLADKGLTSAVFAEKSKFSLWPRSWPDSIDRFKVAGNPKQLVAAAAADLGRERRALTFVHVAAPDAVGHTAGWGSPAYDSAVRRADEAVTQIVEAVSGTPTVLIVTADHGGVRGTPTHANFTHPDAFTIPFVVWGPGVASRDLYRLNPDYKDPGTQPPSSSAPPAVQNGAVANLVAEVLGVRPVPGSVINDEQGLDVRKRR